MVKSSWLVVLVVTVLSGNKQVTSKSALLRALDTDSQSLTVVTQCAGVVDTCVFCDENCQFIAGGKNSAEEYAQQLLARVSKVFLDSDISVTFALQKIETPTELIRLDEALTAEDETSLIGQKPKKRTEKANTRFWESRNFANMKNAYGCDLGLFLSDQSDPIWSKAGTVGAANSCSICKQNSMATVQITGDIERTSAIVAHEIGHLFCMSHDGSSPKAGFNVPASCTNDARCANGKCEMVSSLPSHDYPHKFSGCSKDYFNHWCTYQSRSSDGYDRSCITQDELSTKFTGSVIETFYNTLGDTGSGEEED